MQQGAQVIDALRFGVDDQFVLEGADRAVLADERLQGGQQFGAAAMLKWHHLGGGVGGEAGDQQQGGEKGA
ncbi:hypothetical protein D3C80_1428730 [compost metagenome]